MSLRNLKLTMSFALISIFLLQNCGKDSVSPNEPPVITDVTVSIGQVLLTPSRFDGVSVGQTLRLECLATDAEGDPLSYSWTAIAGSFDQTNVKVVSWTAPDTVGTVEIYVFASDGNNSATDTTILNIVILPTLEAGQVMPSRGNTDNVFTYQVIFTDKSNNAPSAHMVIIDGVSHEMMESTGTLSAGKSYTFQSQLAEGSHTYVFEFKDSDSNIVRFPASTYESAPFVTDPSVVLSENVIVVEDLDSLSLASISSSSLTFGFTGTPPNFQNGNILVGADTTDGASGYLRKIISSRMVSGQIAVETDSIALAQLVEKMDFDSAVTFNFGTSNRRASGINSFLPVYMAPGVNVAAGGISLDNVVLFSGSSGAASIEAKITRGRIAFSPEIDMGAKIGFFELKEFHTTIGGLLEFPVEMQVTASADFSKSGSVTLAKFVKYKVYTMGIPVLVKYTLSFEAGYGASAGIAGTTTFGYAYTNNVKAGAIFQDGIWTPIAESVEQFTVNEPSWNAEANAHGRVYVKPRLDVELFSSAGPFIEVEPNLTFDAKATTPPPCWNWNLSKGLDGRIGFQAHILSYELANYSTTIFSIGGIIRSDEGCLSNDIIVNSTPPGADVYLDGTNMNMVTPATIEGAESGTHKIRLFLERFNEYNETFVLDSFIPHTINADLGEPLPPLPVFTITAPVDSAEFNDNVITVSGLIKLEDVSGNITSFLGNTAILTLNGQDIEIEVTNGQFNKTVSIRSGENTIRLRANSSNGDTGHSETVTVFGAFSNTDIEITLTWNSPTADLDLHVWNPLNEHSYYGVKQISDGSLDFDDLVGFGPETFTSPVALAGTYVVKVNAYALKNDVTSDATIAISLNGSAPETLGPHRFTTSDFNGSTPAAWWEVKTFTFGPTLVIGETKPITEKRARKILSDMKNMPKKTTLRKNR